MRVRERTFFRQVAVRVRVRALLYVAAAVAPSIIVNLLVRATRAVYIKENNRRKTLPFNTGKTDENSNASGDVFPRATAFFSILFATFSDFCSEHAQLRAGRGFALTKRLVVLVVSFGFARQFVHLKIRCRTKKDFHSYKSVFGAGPADNGFYFVTAHIF